MNIKDLELTEEELALVLAGVNFDTLDYEDNLGKAIMSAQFTKALWGVRDMLFVAIKECDSLDQHPAAIAIRNLDYYMSEAGIPRPGEKL